MNRRDKQIILLLTLIYAFLSLFNLGKLHLNNASWIAFDGSDVLNISFNQPTPVAKIYYQNGLINGKYHFTYTTSNGNTYTLYDKNMDNFHPNYQWGHLSIDGAPLITQMSIQVDQAPIEIKQLALFDSAGKYLTNFTLSNNNSSPNVAKLVAQSAPDSIDNSWTSSAIFDEIYYASSAYQYLNGMAPYVDVHPPLGMLLIAVAIALIGMSPFAWRLAPGLSSILLVPLMYVFALKIFKDRRLAVITTILSMCEFMHLTLGRLAFLESIVTLFIVAEYYFLFMYAQSRLSGNTFKIASKYLYTTAICLGLAMATKLNALFSVPAILVWLIYCELIKSKTNLKQLIVLALHLGLIFIIIPLTIYTLSYIPYAIGQHTDNLLSFVIERFTYMQHFQMQTMQNTTHPYASNWWTWPLLSKPVSIYYWQDLNGYMSTSIVLMGNPAIYWLSIPAILFLLYTWLKDRTNYIAAFILIAIFAQYLPFALIKRLSFLYYFYPTTPFIILAITYALKLVFASKNKAYIYTAYTYIGVVILLFILFFPVLSGIAIPRTYTVNTLWFLKTWNF